MSNVLNAENRFPRNNGNNAKLFGLSPDMWAKYWAAVQEDNETISWGAVMFWHAVFMFAQSENISDEEFEERLLLIEIADAIFCAQFHNTYFYEGIYRQSTPT